MEKNFTFNASRYLTATECSFKRLHASKQAMTIFGSGKLS